MKAQNRSVLPALENNVGLGERVLSLLAGSFLLYNALTGGRSVPKGLAAGFLLFRGATGYSPTYHALGIDRSDGRTRNINIKTSVTVNKPRHEVYAFWRQLENLPLFMKHLESVTRLGEKTSVWKARIPGGMGTISWTSEIVEDQENTRIGWRSLPGSTIENAGNVHFRDAGKFGTEVHAVISYHAPGGVAGQGLAKLLNPFFEEMVKEDIKNFRRYLESGELPTIAGQPSGKTKILRG